MHRLIKTTCFALVCMVFVPFYAYAQSAQIIYKHVDENGRVTYSNSPIKGAERMDLQPITVLPSTLPASSTASGNVAVARVTTVPRTPKTVAVAAMNVAHTMAAKPAEASLPAKDAIETSASANASLAMTAPTAATEPANVLATPTQARQAELQRRSLQNSLLAEQESLANAKAGLADESRKSDSIRALRASFSAAPDKSGIKKLITTEQREQVEHHFERIRDLQDEITMHEKNVVGLRSQLRAEPAAGVVAVQ